MSARYTIMMVRDRSSRVRRIRLSKSTIWTVVSFALFVLCGVVVAGIHYYSVVEKVSENRGLRSQNLELRNRLVGLHEKVASIQAVIDRVQRFDTKLRIITQLHDPERHLAMGPVGSATEGDGAQGEFGTPAMVQAIGKNPHLAVNLLGKQLDELASEAEEREGNIRELETYLRGQRARLSSTPSIWPTHGWVTSDFGTRIDPYTKKRSMHRGIDIANQPGIPVTAPAKGVVTFASSNGGFGNMLVLDHGYGIRTRYGHLSQFKAHIGDHVERGEIVGNIGNTGRSTGPHLHYEVEVNGVCENPKNYMLDD